MHNDFLTSTQVRRFKLEEIENVTSNRGLVHLFTSEQDQESLDHFISNDPTTVAGSEIEDGILYPFSIVSGNTLMQLSELRGYIDIGIFWHDLR